jgi:hypothetical protein
MRDAQSVGDVLKSRLPGARQTLPERQTTVGTPVPEHGYPLAVRLGTPTDDPVLQAIRDVDASIPEMSRHIKGRDGELPPEEFAQMNRQAGQMATQMLLPFISSPQWEQLKAVMPAVARKEIEGVFKKARAYAREPYNMQAQIELQQEMARFQGTPAEIYNQIVAKEEGY